MSIQLIPSSTKQTTATKTAKAEKAASLIKPASDIDAHLKMCLYGRNGAGKTTYLASSELKTLIIDCNEQGWKAARKRPNVDVYPVEFWEQLDWVYWYLKGSNHPYEVVGIDTITMLANIGMKWVLGDEVSRDASRDPQMPDKRVWGKLGEVMKTTIINFRNLPMHVIFTAQEKMTTNEDDEGGIVVEIHPELSPSPRSTLLSAVDIIGRIYTSQTEKEGKKLTERRMLLGTHPKYVSKNRFDELKAIERNPTLQSFLDKIFATGGNDANEAAG
jgi:phage nucleotide-binding protein